MKVALSALGRFHFFNLAIQLEKRGYLSQLITSYPEFAAARFGVPTKKATAHVMKEVLQRVWERLPPIAKRAWNPQYFFHGVFDRASARSLRNADLLVAQPSLYRHTMREAKRRGMKVVVENGSAHSRVATRLVREEYERFGVDPPPFILSHPKALEDDYRAYEEMDYISVPSLFVKRSFIEEGIPERKLIHVPYGADLREFYPAPKQDDTFRIIYAGGIVLPKGVQYLLRAFTELALPKSELLLVGSLGDDMKSILKKYDGSFKWIGHVPQNELRSHYSQSSVFAMASVQEGLALVQLQAMACGLPVVATTNTGAEDIVRDGKDGFIVPIRDIEALKEKILYLYEHPEEREQMGRSAREHVASGFTWDDYGDKITAEYERILNH